MAGFAYKRQSFQRVIQPERVGTGVAPYVDCEAPTQTASRRPIMQRIGRH